VIVFQGGSPWGLLVDEVTQVTVEPEHHHRLPPLLGEEAGCPFESVLQFQEDPVLLLDPEGLHSSPDNAHSRSNEFKLVIPPQPLVSSKRMSAAQAALRQLLLFTTADALPHPRPLVFGLKLTQVQAIVEMPPLVPVPCMPSFVAGITLWRNRPVTVLDLAQRLGLPPSAPEKRTRLLVVPAGGEKGLIGFPVRPSIRVLNLPVEHRPCTRMPPVDTSFVRGTVELRKETLVVPDLDRILTAS
jgi:purine-binding chemotaxis protein CheW